MVCVTRAQVCVRAAGAWGRLPSRPLQQGSLDVGKAPGNAEQLQLHWC